MFPLIIVAFAGIGVTRLALLALELHESNNPDEEDGAIDIVSKETIIEELRRMEKPKKLILKNECQYVCIWREEDFTADLPLDDLLHQCAERRKVEEPNELYRAFQEMAAFFDQLVGTKNDQGFEYKASLSASAAPAAAATTTISVVRPFFSFSSQSLRREEEEISVLADERREGEALGYGGARPLPAASMSSAAASAAGCGPQRPPSTGRLPAAGDLMIETSSSIASEEEADGYQETKEKMLSLATSPVGRGCCDDGTNHVADMDLDDHNGEDMCVVCYDNKADAVLLTCGHSALCFSCAVDVYRSSRECPLCRSTVDQILTVGEKEVLPNGLLVVPVIGP